MAAVVLGLDIGGANLKAATADRRAASVPFALWKQPDRLPAALADVVAQFPDADELAVTMTGELCDCFETKRDGVNAILTAVQNVSRGRRVRVWSTDGVFVSVDDARRDHLKVAAANWHALATFAGQYVPEGPATLIDIGSTTTDVIPILDGKPVPVGKTDTERMRRRELIYVGVRRTPVMALVGVDEQVAGELFATTLDVYLHLGMIADDPTDTDTADGRPATRKHALNRLCRMYCGDCETVALERIDEMATQVRHRHLHLIEEAFDRAWYPIEVALREQCRQPKNEPGRTVIVSGSGSFLRTALTTTLSYCEDMLSLEDRLGAEVSACAPAYALAVLATEGLPAPGGRITRGLWPWSGS